MLPFEIFESKLLEFKKSHSKIKDIKFTLTDDDCLIVEMKTYTRTSIKVFYNRDFPMKDQAKIMNDLIQDMYDYIVNGW